MQGSVFEFWRSKNPFFSFGFQVFLLILREGGDVEKSDGGVCGDAVGLAVSC